jgi:hypothetical protein
MRCKFDEKILLLYFDNELGEYLASKVKNHLAICRNCRQKLATYELLRRRLAEACAFDKAPEHLRHRIDAALVSEAAQPSIRLNPINKIKLILTDFYPSRIVALGAALAIVLLLALIPGGGLNTVASTLAAEHFMTPEQMMIQAFHSSEPGEINAYFHRLFGREINIPEYIGDGIGLDCVCLFYLDGKPVAHAIYKKGGLMYSLFVGDKKIIRSNRSNMFMASGREFEFGSKQNVNLICWDLNNLIYILVGCCPHETLVNLAVASI